MRLIGEGGCRTYPFKLLSVAVFWRPRIIRSLKSLGEGKQTITSSKRHCKHLLYKEILRIYRNILKTRVGILLQAKKPQEILRLTAEEAKIRLTSTFPLP